MRGSDKLHPDSEVHQWQKILKERQRTLKFHEKELQDLVPDDSTNSYSAELHRREGETNKQFYERKNKNIKK
jgi:hypothetical protein